MSSISKEGLEEDHNSGNKISKWVYVAIVMAGILSYYLFTPSTDEVIEKCIHNYAESLAKRNTNDSVTSEVIGSNGIVISPPPENSGYYILSFNVRLLIKENFSINSKQQNIPVKGFKCFYDSSKYNEWKQRNNP